MSCAVFPLFLNLPWELRRLIWEAAVRPTGSGVHTFSILHRDTMEAEDDTPRKMLPHYKYKGNYLISIPETDEGEKPNRPAYFWDAGLWTACKESREAIVSCLNFRQWRRDFFTNILYEDYESKQLSKHRRNYVSMTNAPSMTDGGEDWCLLVRPFRDAIKPTQETIENWAHCGYIDWRELFNDIPFSANRWPDESSADIILEFDPSWTSTDTFRSNSTYKFLFEMIVDSVYQGNEDWFIWLVDRGKYHHEPYEEVKEPLTFYDCNDEYVQVLYRFDDCDDASAAFFIKELDKAGDETWRADRWEEEPFTTRLDRWSRHAWEQIAILRPRSLLKAQK